jgi:phosphoserine phosphatase RsbU/P
MQTAHSPDNIPSPAQGTPAEKPAQILVVDDDESNRESLRRRLARHGYEVIAVADGRSALEMIERQTFDLMLLDVMMPGMSGLEVLERVRQHRSHTDLPIIMASAQDRSEDVVNALDNGANDYVTKPLEFAVVLARVRTQLLLKKAVNLAADLEHRLSDRNVDLEAANAKLELHARRAAYDLETAAKVQKTFLPSRSPKIAGSSFAWVYEPCQALAGDSLNILQLDADHVAFYVLDVSGHGVAASLLAVAATRLLSEIGFGNSIVMQFRDGAMAPVPPAEVADTLNKRFETNSETGQFMTLFYAIYNARNQMLTYVSAGHPGAIQVGRNKEPCTLHGTGLPIGFGQQYEQQSVRLDPGDRVYLYSDGVTEAMDPSGKQFGDTRLLEAIGRGRTSPLQESVANLNGEIAQWRGSERPKDDISILAVEVYPG